MQDTQLDSPNPTHAPAGRVKERTHVVHGLHTCTRRRQAEAQAAGRLGVAQPCAAARRDVPCGCKAHTCQTCRCNHSQQRTNRQAAAQQQRAAHAQHATTTTHDMPCMVPSRMPTGAPCGDTHTHMVCSTHTHEPAAPWLGQMVRHVCTQTTQAGGDMINAAPARWTCWCMCTAEGCAGA
jgi:hypothetical protein